MASKYEISTVFKMIDNFTGPMKNIAGSSTGFAKQFSANMRKTEMQIQAAGRAMKTMAGVAVGAGAALAGVFVSKSLKNFVDFDEAMHGAGAAFSDLANLDSVTFEEKLKDIGLAARMVAASTEFDMMQAAEGLKTFAQAGVKSDAAVIALTKVADFATAAGTDLANGTGLMLNSLNTLGMFSDVPDILSKNMERLSDVMAYTANSAKMTVVDVAEAIKIGGAGFTKTNQNINDMSAAITALASKGYVGAEAGNALKNIMVKMVGLTPQAIQALESMGITTVDSEGNMLNFIDVIEQFENAMVGMGDAEIEKNLKAIFGLENITQFKAILSTGSESLRQFSENAANSGGAVSKMAERIRGSLGNQIKVLNSEITELGAKIALVILDNGGSNLIEKLTEFIHNFDPAPIINVLTSVMQALPGIIEGIGNVFQFLWNMKDVIGALVIAWGAYKVALIAALAVEKVIGFVTAIQAVMAATQGMTAAQAALNVVMNANPIGIIITAFAALGLGIYEVIKHWDTISASMSVAWGWIQKIASIIWDSLLVAFENVKNFFLGFQPLLATITGAIENAWGWIQKVSSIIWDSLLVAFESVKNFLVDFQPLLTMLLGPMGMVVNMIVEIVKNFNNLKAAFAEGGFIAGIKAIGATIVSSILAPIQKVLELMTKIPFVGDKFQGGLDMISSVRQNAVSSNPSVTTPVTQGERTAYSMSETVNEDHVMIDVALDKGLNGTVSGSAPKASLNLVKSGAW